MTYFPKYLTEYPNGQSLFPFHIKINQITNGYPSHRHDFLEFSFVIAGEGLEIINGESHEMRPGTFTFVMPYQVHEIQTAPGSILTLYNCNFGLGLLLDGSLDPELSKSYIENNEILSPYKQFTQEESRMMETTLKAALLEYNNDLPYKQASLKAKLMDVLTQFQRNRQILRFSETHSSSNTPYKGNVWKIIQYVHLHYKENISLTGMADHFGCSVSYISELVKEAIGQNFIDFLHDIRIRHACSLLLSTEMKITDIALEVGCGTYQTFSRNFRQLKQVTPQEYRNKRLM